jgi:hypothetical protein
MKLNVPNPSAESVHEQLGMSTPRAEEISKQMDDLFTKGKPRMMPAAVAFSQIAELCNTLGEFTFALSTHMNWLINTDRQQLAPALPYTVVEKIRKLFYQYRNQPEYEDTAEGFVTYVLNLTPKNKEEL